MSGVSPPCISGSAPVKGTAFICVGGWQTLVPVRVWTPAQEGTQGAAGLETSRYSGHSLHIGAATSVAAAGVPDHLIKVLGCWRSEAFQLYIRTPPDTLLSVASMIGGRQ